MEIDDKLLLKIKSKLRITFNHQDDLIKDMISEGVAFLESKAGPLPIHVEENSRLTHLSIKLLKEYCRYDWNGTIALFEKDYLSDILNLQIQAAMERRKKNG